MHVSDHPPPAPPHRNGGSEQLRHDQRPPESRAAGQFGETARSSAPGTRTFPDPRRRGFRRFCCERRNLRRTLRPFPTGRPEWGRFRSGLFTFPGGQTPIEHFAKVVPHGRGDFAGRRSHRFSRPPDSRLRRRFRSPAGRFRPLRGGACRRAFLRSGRLFFLLTEDEPVNQKPEDQIQNSAKILHGGYLPSGS